MTEEKATPRLKLISKNDYEEVKNKFDFFSDEKKASLSPIIASAQPSDVLALTVVQGSGLKILNVEILNESKEEVFIKLLKEGVGDIEF